MKNNVTIFNTYSREVYETGTNIEVIEKHLHDQGVIINNKGFKLIDFIDIDKLERELKQ